VSADAPPAPAFSTAGRDEAPAPYRPDSAELAELMAENPFFAGLKSDFSRTLADCARFEVYQAGERLFHEGSDANAFYLMRHGTVAIEVRVPGKGLATLQTLHENEVIGWSWLVPPYRWTFDARAVTLTRVVAMDARCMLGKFETDHELGYTMLTRFVRVMSERLHAARIQMLDMYGPGGAG